MIYHALPLMTINSLSQLTPEPLLGTTGSFIVSLGHLCVYQHTLETSAAMRSQQKTHSRTSGFFEPVERIFLSAREHKGHRLSRILTLVHQEHQDGIVLRKTLHLGANGEEMCIICMDKY